MMQQQQQRWLPLHAAAELQETAVAAAASCDDTLPAMCIVKHSKVSPTSTFQNHCHSDSSSSQL
jgi:hypothetical protein